MTGAEVQAAYFTPFHFLIYLLIIFGGLMMYYQRTWAKKCARFVKVLVVKPDGSTETEYAPRTGSYVALRSDPDSNTTRLWPINSLAAITTIYPGDAFFPKFMQKEIKTVVVSEEDWEPLLNRGPYTRRVASPDVVAVLRDLADDYPDAKDDITELADSLSTAPTRDLIASPAVLGNIMKEKVSELAVTISKETFDRLEGITRRLDKTANPMILYGGMVIIIVFVAVIAIKVIPVISSIGDLGYNIALIKQALGIP